MTGRNSRTDVVAAAARLFGERGYHGTSMRDLGRALGLNGSSLYSHIASKEDLLVEVVTAGAALFQASAEAARVVDDPVERLRRLIAGHIDVVLDHRDEVRTFLLESGALDPVTRSRITTERNAYEAHFRTALAEGVERGVFAAGLDVALTAIFILSILNAVERWYTESGRLSRRELTDGILDTVMAGIARSPAPRLPA